MQMMQYIADVEDVEKRRIGRIRIVKIRAREGDLEYSLTRPMLAEAVRIRVTRDSI